MAKGAKSSVVLEMTGDERRLLRALQRSEKEVDKLKQKSREAGKTAKDTGKDLEDGFGDKAARNLAGIAAGFIGIGSAISGAQRALREYIQTSEQAAQRQKDVVGLKSQLIQISGGSQQRYNELIGVSEQLRSQYGFTQSQALQATFQGVSLGRTDAQILKAGRYKAFASDPGALIEGTAGLRAAFGPQTLGGSEESQINALLQAAQFSKVNVTELAKASLVPAQPAKKLGARAREVLAAVAVASIGLPSVEEASTAVARFSDVASKNPEFKKLGLGGALEKAAGLPDDKLEKIFGANIRADKGLRVLLQNASKFRSTLSSIDEAVLATGTTESLVPKLVGIGRQSLGLEFGALTAKEQLEFAEEQRRSGNKLQIQRIHDYTLRRLEEQGASPFRIGLARAQLYLDEFNLGGAPGDLGQIQPSRYKIGAERILGEKINLEQPFASDSVDEQKKTNNLLQQILDNSGYRDVIKPIAKPAEQP